jgi:flagellar biogenesis protein FliO
MINFFRPVTGSDRPPASAMLKRAGFFAAGLVLLWLAVELMPTAATPEPVVHETADGGVAFRTKRTGSPIRPGVVVATMILIGGVVLAVGLRKRSSEGAPAGPLATIADMPITSDQRLRLIRCGGDVLLLGITSGGVSVLEKYAADTFDAGNGDDARALSPAFADLLRDAAGRFRDTPRN